MFFDTHGPGPRLAPGRQRCHTHAASRGSCAARVRGDLAWAPGRPASSPPCCICSKRPGGPLQTIHLHPARLCTARGEATLAHAAVHSSAVSADRPHQRRSQLCIRSHDSGHCLRLPVFPGLYGQRGAGAIQLPGSGDRLPLGEPGACGEHLVERPAPSACRTWATTSASSSSSIGHTCSPAQQRQALGRPGHQRRPLGVAHHEHPPPGEHSAGTKSALPHAVGRHQARAQRLVQQRSGPPPASAAPAPGWPGTPGTWRRARRCRTAPPGRAPRSDDPGRRRGGRRPFPGSQG